MTTKPQHREAFMLMIYRSNDGAQLETLWNSRNGVTPFVISGRGEDAPHLSHVHWGLDVFAPAYVPNIGSRIFVDMTQERATFLADEYIARWWNDPETPMSKAYESIEVARTRLIADMLKPGAPDVVMVTAEMQRALLARAEQSFVQRQRHVQHGDRFA